MEQHRHFESGASPSAAHSITSPKMPSCLPFGTRARMMYAVIKSLVDSAYATADAIPG